MIAQPILAVPAAKTSSAPQQQQQLQSANANGFLALLTATDPTLTAIAQATGAATPSVAPANINKPAKPSDPSAAPASSTSTTPYVAPPAAPAPTAATAAAATVAAAATSALVPSDLLATINGNALPTNAPPTNAFLAAANAAAGNAVQNGPASGAQATDTSQATTAAPTGNGNSTAFGDQINARVAAGAPIYASQPTATMATVPPHLLDAAVPHPQPGAVPDKAGGDTSGKPSTATNATPSSAMQPASTPTASQPQLPPTHVAANDPNGSFSNNGGAAPATTAASDNTSAAGSDASAASVPLLAQSNAPLASTPAQVDAAVHTAAPYVPVGEQVALNLKQAIATDSNEIRIQLKPASLGTIDVKLNLTQDGRVSAVITADRSDTLNMLKQDSGTLQQGLRDAGLNADNSSLSFGLRGDSGQSFAQNSSQGGSGHSGGGYYRSSVADTLIGARSAAPAQRFHSGSLDIEV